MSGIWTVKDIYRPRSDASEDSEDSMLQGFPIEFEFGDKLERDDTKTASQEKNGVLIRQWFWLMNGDQAGYVPYNPDNPNDIKSVAIERQPGTETPFKFKPYREEISRLDFIEACIRKAIRWETNAAYLYALAWLESGDVWPDGKVNSPPSKQGQTAIGTFRFTPSTWGTLVDKFPDQLIKPSEIIYPQAQLTFAAAQASASYTELTEKLARKATYVDLYLAHLFTNKGCVAISKADPDTPAKTVLDTVFTEQNPVTKGKRLTEIFTRKSNLLSNNGSSVSVRELIANIVSALTKGFNEVKQVAAKLAPSAPAGPEDSTTSTAAGSDELGILSEEFESNGNPAAIGFDKKGGWSYGMYQIATRTGTFKKFMSFLSDNGFDTIATVLNNAGETQAAINGTDTFKKAWQGLKGGPKFIPAQHDFIKATHYDVMVKKLASRIDINAHSVALQNVVWSTAVQHGPNSKIVQKVIDKVGATNDATIINGIYNERSRVNVYFSGSSQKVKNSVLNRFKRERKLALKMLADEGGS